MMGAAPVISNWRRLSCALSLMTCFTASMNSLFPLVVIVNLMRWHCFACLIICGVQMDNIYLMSPEQFDTLLWVIVLGFVVVLWAMGFAEGNSGAR